MLVDLPSCTSCTVAVWIVPAKFSVVATVAARFGSSIQTNKSLNKIPVIVLEALETNVFIKVYKQQVLTFKNNLKFDCMNLERKQVINKKKTHWKFD